MLSYLTIKVNDCLYIKDPESSDVGRRILQHGIRLMDEIGVEEFTFKKLANRAKTTESTVYRYFENKHKLLLYLSNWYWAWLDYRLVFAIHNVDDPWDKLERGIEILATNAEVDHLVEHIDLVTLGHVIHTESSKIFRIKDVDRENREGLYKGYKRLCARLQEIILEIKPDFAYANSLASTIYEGIQKQYFFAEHLPSLTNVKQPDTELPTFFLQMAHSMLAKPKMNTNDE